MILPALSMGLRGAMRTIATQESMLTSKVRGMAGFSAPSILREAGNVVEKTVGQVMTTVERGTGNFLR